MAPERYIACLLSISNAFFMDVCHYEIDVIIIVIIGVAYREKFSIQEHNNHSQSPNNLEIIDN